MAPFFLPMPAARWSLPLAALLLAARPLPAEEAVDYALPDPQLKIVRIDRLEKASLVAVRADTAGRIFVGGRDTLFVYEPDAQGGYRPRRALYRFPPESWVFDIAIRGHDLYVATASAIYVLPGAVIRREGIQARRLLWGQPRGHLQLGFFGLAWGPEGDLYSSIGDPLQHYGDFQRADHWGHWTFFGPDERVRTPYTGVGAVLRCRPDGSRLQVVASGIFRPCGLAFDPHWNLFTCDNDREAMPVQYVPARLLHVTPHAYFGWPRGWMARKTPDRFDLLETMFGGLGREAPVGLAYYDEPWLPAAYREKLLLARWAQRAVSRFSLARRGASFRAAEQPLLIGRRRARPVGLAVGGRGRLLVTILHMAHLESSPSATSDLVMITRGDGEGGPAQPCYDAAAAPLERLWNELSHRAWWRRRAAHVELMRRGGRALAEATARLRNVSDTDPAINHLPYLAAAHGDAQAIAALSALAGADHAPVRLQAVRALAGLAGRGAPPDVFARSLGDPDPQVRLAALAAYFQLDAPPPELPLVALARSDDTYLRQTATRLLARRAKLDDLESLCAADDVPTRLAGTLAAGFRLTLPPATRPLPATTPLAPFPETACLLRFADGTADLRRLGRTGMFTLAEQWRAAKPTEEQARLFRLLLKTLEDPAERVRLQGAYFLSLLDDPRSQPRVARVRVASEQARLAALPVSEIRPITQAWVVGPFPDGPEGLGAVHPPEQGPIDLAARYRSGETERTWQQARGRYFDFRQLPGRHDNASVYAYCRLQSPRRQRILLFVGSNDGVIVWHNGRPVWKNDVVRRALAFQDPVLLDLEAGSNELLVKVHNATGATGMYLSFKAAGPVTAALPEKLAFDTLAERLEASRGEAAVPAALLGVDWPAAARRGDPRRGRKLFSADGLACAKCHAIDGQQESGGGPSLAEAGKRFTIAHLVESILLPSKNIAPVFRATQIITTDGRQISGLVVGETADRLELLLSDTTHKTVRKRDIETRALRDVSPMPQGIVKTPDELADLLAYLLSGSP